MSFQVVSNKVDFPAQERELLRFWKESRAFEKLRHLHKDDPPWSFIDGPITANNPMGVHHGWGRTYKDLMQRFQTMRGHKLRYQNGFDCQGLWVEVEVEKEQGFRSKQDIEAFGLEAFVLLCKARVLRYAAVQTEQSIRLGYWMDWNDPDQLRWLADELVKNPSQEITIEGPHGPVTGSVEQIVGQLGSEELAGSYFTFSNENNYMIWRFLKKCWENGWVYRGADVMPWCPRCATAISQHEIVTDGYAELTHDSVTLRFPLTQPDPSGKGFISRTDSQTGLPEALLVWTTTPWTLTSNVAAAVGPELDYLKVRQGDEVLYLSKGTQHMLRGEYQVLGEIKGTAMQGWTYSGPFDDLHAAQEPGGYTHLKELKRNLPYSAVQSHRVILWDAVGEAEGTGIVHIAPGCGAEDFQLGREHRLPPVAPLDDQGYFREGFGWLSGQHVSQVAGPIFSTLEQKGLLYQVAPYRHRYPTCWRCKTELVFRLVDEWFISMGEVYEKPRHELNAQEKASSLRYQIMDVVDRIRWIPAFGYEREMDWLRNMHDCMIGKKRYWGLALPIWVCESCQHFVVIGDEEELQAAAVSGWDQFAGHTPHRPHIDAVKLACPQCSGQMSRIPDVGNPWLDAGIVPFSTLHYRSDPGYWRTWYPAQWITESFPGQFRNWFYSLLAMATVLDQSPPFLENLGYATLVAEDGRPMHKSWGNAIEFNEAADQMGVDVMRWLYFSQKPENDLLFGYGRGDEARRQFLLPLWNVYSFFVTYANLDGWTPSHVYDPHTPEGPTPGSEHVLDRWILSRLNEVNAVLSDRLAASEFYLASLAVSQLIDDLTNWYVRRSRRRFWKSEQDTDKQEAYATLYHVLVKLARLLAPVTPFVTEAIYQNMVRSAFPQAFESIHHTRWPEADLSAVDADLLEQMDLARQAASLGLSARSSAGLKVRQPLARALAYDASHRSLNAELVEIIKDELNVKRFELVEDPGSLVTYQILPDNKLLGPRFGARFPQVRAALQAGDAARLASRLNAGEPVELMVDGERVQLAPEEVQVHTQPAPGLAVASAGSLTLAVDTGLTEDLRREGLARELVRRIQALRKEAGFQIEERIETYYQFETHPQKSGAQDAQRLESVFKEWADYICAETLSTRLAASPPPQDSSVETLRLEGDQVLVGVRRAAKKPPAAG